MTAGTADRILDAAHALLVEGGAGFGYDALARKAGVSRQTLYAHFPTRTDLLLALTDRARKELDVDTMSARVLQVDTADDALSAFVDVHLVFSPHFMHVARVVEFERANVPELAAAFDARTVGRRALVRHVVTRLRAEGRLHPSWTVDAATDVVTVLTSATVTFELLEGRGWSHDQLRRHLPHTLRAALLAPLPQEGTTS